jgi:transcriptional regulator with XRE-family HTH domain
MDIKHMFATRIKKLREGKYNQGEFADSVGVSRGAMSYYEQEARLPDIGVLRQICEAHKVPADYLIGITDDPEQLTADVCAETGLLPIAAKRLLLLRKLDKMKLESALTIVEQFGDDADEALKLAASAAATPMINLLLATDEGLSLLNYLSAIVFGAEFVTGSDIEPRFVMRTTKNFEVAFALENITAALWVNIQHEAEKLKTKLDAVEPE